jgi:hypothetical protein
VNREHIQELLKDRHALDAIARAVVTGERGLGPVDDAIADDIAAIMTGRLAAARSPGERREPDLPPDLSTRRQRAEQQYGRQMVELLIRRTDKHLGQAAMAAYLRGDS